MTVLRPCLTCGHPTTSSRCAKHTVSVAGVSAVRPIFKHSTTFVTVACSSFFSMSKPATASTVSRIAGETVASTPSPASDCVLTVSGEARNSASPGRGEPRASFKPRSSLPARPHGSTMRVSEALSDDPGRPGNPRREEDETDLADAIGNDRGRVFRLGEPGFEGIVRRRFVEGHLTEAERNERVVLHRVLRGRAA